MKYTKEMIQAWHEEGVRLADQWLRCEHRMVEILSKMYMSEGYYLYGCNNLREYALEKWKLPENAASDLITVARKASEIPAMVSALKEGRATLSKLRKVCPVITVENHEDWLELVATSSKRTIEKTVATEKPETMVWPRMTYKAENLIELRAGIGEETMHDIECIMDVLSQKERRVVTLSEALKFMASFCREKIDPLKKAERAKKRKEKKDGAPQEKRGPGRVPLDAETKHELNLRDQMRCTHVNENGSRCLNRRWLEVHHRTHVQNGGGNELDNLQTLCSDHHRAYHHPWWQAARAT